MGKTTYEKLKIVFSKKFQNEDIVTLETLKEFIMLNIGSDPRTVKQSLEVLKASKMIREDVNGRFKVKIK